MDINYRSILYGNLNTCLTVISYIYIPQLHIYIYIYTDHNDYVLYTYIILLCIGPIMLTVLLEYIDVYNFNLSGNAK